MRSAVIAAVVSLLVASGGAYAASRISGSAIAPHSIPANRLTKSAAKKFGTPPAPLLAAAVNGTIDYQQTTTPIAYVAAPQTFDAPCPDGEIAVGGGYTITGDKPEVTEDAVTSDGSSWEVVLWDGDHWTSVDPPTIVVYATCEPSAPTSTDTTTTSTTPAG